MRKSYQVLVRMFEKKEEVGDRARDGSSAPTNSLHVGYTSLDDAAPAPFPGPMPTTPPPEPRLTESVHSPPPENKAKPLISSFGALAPRPHAGRVQEYNISLTHVMMSPFVVELLLLLVAWESTTGKDRSHCKCCISCR